MAAAVTQEINASRDISIPAEWLVNIGVELFGYAQLTLVDDRIVIHEPLAAGIKYERACKVSDGSYIRRVDITGARLPAQLLKPLGIRNGDKVDLALEENCISIRRNTDADEPSAQPAPPEPILSVCCVCGRLQYTENGLRKIASKYICRDCIEAVKSL